MSDFIPYPFNPTDAAIDISFVFKNERPAGKHGFLTVKGAEFCFEDGTPGRFWGTNLNGGACFPEHDYAKKLARRLAKFGLNIVRFHQLDADFNTPNIFQSVKGPLRTSSQSFDPESMDRLDFFVYCLKQEGIYVYLDLLTYRRFKSDDGVVHATMQNDAGKPYCIFNRRMIELQKQYAHDLYNHVNPYTGVAYKDEPAIVMSEIANECDLFSRPIILEPYVTEFKDLFRAWLQENNIDFDVETCDLADKAGVVAQFKKHLHEKYYKEMYEYVRSIGVRVPITGTNWNSHPSLLQSNSMLDYTDSHTYHYDWRWTPKEKMFTNTALSKVEDIAAGRLTRMRSLDKPFFVSEWDVPWPNPYRAEAPILFAAIGSFQGWSGFTIHTYSYKHTQEGMDVLGKELYSDGICNIPYREGIFSTWNDPAKFGMFYHAALITRRGDVAQANKTAEARLPVFPGEKPVKHDAGETDLARYNNVGGGTWAQVTSQLTEIHKVGGTNADTSNADMFVTDPDTRVLESDGEVLSDNGQMYRNWKKGYGWIDSPMTKCVYGSLKKNGKQQITDMTVDCQTDFAVIAVSSLTDAPLNQSDNILLTTGGRAVNTDAQFDGDKMLKLGKAPVQVEVIKADITLKTDKKALKVWAISPEGIYEAVVPSVIEDGELRFSVGNPNGWNSMYYLIQAE